MAPGLLAFYSFLFGAAIGSFLNVVIYRLPRGESLVWPGSHCPNCGASVPLWANIPILSYLFLRGRCLACGNEISLRYLLVEVATALLFACLMLRWGPEVRLVGHWIVGAVLIAVAFIDGEHRIIPNPLTLPLVPVGIGLALLAPPPTLSESLLGLALGGGMLWALSAGYEWRTGSVGLGMGDVKLVAMLGAYLGALPVLGVVVVGSLLGLVQGVWLMTRGRGGRKTAIPFGPALATGGLLHLYAPMWVFDLTGRVLGS
jgi:leader peptidase (prepilin peptidase)/N-methyltransferase